MSKFAKPLLQQLRIIWQAEFPFLLPAASVIVPSRQKLETFTAQQHSEPGLFYHFCVHFSPKRVGEFTMEIFFSDKPTQEVMDIRWPTDIPERKLGQYRIGWFIDGRDHWWGLKDNDAEHNEFLRSLDPNFSDELLLPRREDLWLPSSTSLPLDAIVTEAIADVNQKLRDYVFPKLGLP